MKSDLSPVSFSFVIKLAMTPNIILVLTDTAGSLVDLEPFCPESNPTFPVTSESMSGPGSVFAYVV